MVKIRHRNNANVKWHKNRYSKVNQKTIECKHPKQATPRKIHQHQAQTKALKQQPHYELPPNHTPTRTLAARPTNNKSKTLWLLQNH